MRIGSVLTDRNAQYQSVALILLSMLCFAIVDALGKTVALIYPANEVTFFRMLFGVAPALAVCLRGRSIADRIRKLDVRGQAIRALTLIGASALFFAGLPYLPPSKAVAIVYPTIGLKTLAFRPGMKGGCRQRSRNIMIFSRQTRTCLYGETTVSAHEPHHPRPSFQAQRQTRQAAA